ncbi:dsRBD fold-containing protein [Streptomyces sp. WMMC940]|nr:dsRBD fold-containing protein [Streptomyces sp. WMMC940]MCZ7462422.1 DUF1876 family protein [Streptomyces sp. WMMC940]
MPHIGDELAVARALNGVSHSLLHEVATEIESRTGEQVHRLREG